MRASLWSGASMLWLCVACRAEPAAGRPDEAPSAPASSTAAPLEGAAPVKAAPRVEGPTLPSAYAAELAKVRDLEYPALVREAGVTTNVDARLPFRVESAKYFPLVQRVLKLTREETHLLTSKGLVSVDHQQRYSMASAYASIYGRDLPVLITADSILHALHRSYDRMLIELETEWFSVVLRRYLQAVQDALAAAPKEDSAEPVRNAREDVGTYVGVALALLAGAGAPATETVEATPTGTTGGEPPDAKPPVVSPAIAPILARIAALASGRLALNGGEREVDFSQFRVRGHYTSSAVLQRYFRTMMWLGRADLGFVLGQPPSNNARIDLKREQRAAAALTLVLEQQRQLDGLRGMSEVIDFMVGSSDDLDVHDLASARRKAGLQTLGDLADDAKLVAFERELAALRGGQASQIRSQTLIDSPVPLSFQLFGQRFTPDSFVLSNLVFDSIWFRGTQPERMMPSGLDVMAALGNDTALQLQRADIEKYKYGANLLAARRALAGQPAEFWRASVYTLWLDALRILSAPAANRGAMPFVMQSAVWQKKQLTTQLASWAELRHDTILYAKQSYTAVPGCGYPAGYVEPYPAFFERMELMANEAARHLRASDVTSSDQSLTEKLKGLQAEQAHFFDQFAARMADLRRLADKELRSEPFTQEESDFLKKTVDRTMIGSGIGVLAYTGWYPGLIYGGEPAAWKPTVADIHTAGDQVLEEAVGDVNFLVVAVDNQRDRAVYVGPVFSHYEFQQPVTSRMRDEEFARLIEQNRAPPRPAWTRDYQAPAFARVMPDVPIKKRSNARPTRLAR